MLSHFSCIRLFVTPWTVAHQAPLSTGFPGKNTGVGCHFLLQKLLIEHIIQWQPTPVLLLGKSHGQRSIVGYSPWRRKESDTTEQIHFTSLSEGWASWAKEWSKTMLCQPTSQKKKKKSWEEKKLFPHILSRSSLRMNSVSPLKWKTKLDNKSWVKSS